MLDPQDDAVALPPRLDLAAWRAGFDDVFARIAGRSRRRARASGRGRTCSGCCPGRSGRTAGRSLSSPVTPAAPRRRPDPRQTNQHQRPPHHEPVHVGAPLARTSHHCKRARIEGLGRVALDVSNRCCLPLRRGPSRAWSGWATRRPALVSPISAAQEGKAPWWSLS